MKELKKQIEDFMSKNKKKTFLILRTSTNPSVKDFLYIDEITATTNSADLESVEDWIKSTFKIGMSEPYDSVNGRLYIIAY